MTFTYSGDPGSSTRDLVRFLITDTNAAEPLFQDTELDYLVTTWENGYTAAIAAVRTLIGRVADGSSESKKVGDLSLASSTGSSTGKLQSLIQQLETARFSLYPAAPIVNANSLLKTVEKIDEDSGSDFVLGQMDNKT
jgi:hypothetical protein